MRLEIFEYTPDPTQHMNQRFGQYAGDNFSSGYSSSNVYSSSDTYSNSNVYSSTLSGEYPNTQYSNEYQANQAVNNLYSNGYQGQDVRDCRAGTPLAAIHNNLPNTTLTPAPTSAPFSPTTANGVNRMSPSSGVCSNGISRVNRVNGASNLSEAPKSDVYNVDWTNWKPPINHISESDEYEEEEKDVILGRKPQPIHLSQQNQQPGNLVENRNLEEQEQRLPYPEMDSLWSDFSGNTGNNTNTTPNTNINANLNTGSNAKSKTDAYPSPNYNQSIVYSPISPSNSSFSHSSSSPYASNSSCTSNSSYNASSPYNSVFSYSPTSPQTNPSSITSPTTPYPPEPLEPSNPLDSLNPPPNYMRPLNSPQTLGHSEPLRTFESPANVRQLRPSKTLENLRPMGPKGPKEPKGPMEPASVGQTSTCDSYSNQSSQSYGDKHGNYGSPPTHSQAATYTQNTPNVRGNQRRSNAPLYNSKSMNNLNAQYNRSPTTNANNLSSPGLPYNRAEASSPFNRNEMSSKGSVPSSVPTLVSQPNPQYLNGYHGSKGNYAGPTNPKPQGYQNYPSPKPHPVSRKPFGPPTNPANPNPPPRAQPPKSLVPAPLPNKHTLPSSHSNSNNTAAKITMKPLPQRQPQAALVQGPTDLQPPPRPKPSQHTTPSTESLPHPSSYTPSSFEKDRLDVKTFELLRKRCRPDSSGNSTTGASDDELLEFAKALVEASQMLAHLYSDPNTPAGASNPNRAPTVDLKTERKNQSVWTSEAHKIVKKLSSRGHPASIFYLASSYGSGGLGLPVDYDRAYQLYHKAASKYRHPESAYRTAVCNEIGAGTRRDTHQALVWYKAAAELGDVSAMYKLGMIALNGLLGEPQSFEKGVVWLQKAVECANEQNPHAVHELGLLYERADQYPGNKEGLNGAADPSRGIEKNEAKAFQLFLQAAKLNYPPSQFRLGCCYEYGTLGCPIDPKKSIAWYSRGAEKGEPESELALSGWYLTGSAGVLVQSDTEAYLWAKRAADKGLSKAEYAVGYYSEVGIGVKANLEEAKRWYFKAAAQRHPKALARLREVK